MSGQNNWATLSPEQKAAVNRAWTGEGSELAASSGSARLLEDLRGTPHPARVPLVMERAANEIERLRRVLCEIRDLCENCKCVTDAKDIARDGLYPPNIGDDLRTQRK